mmetsp:Transcript_50838/g.118074  ORF Transcript_50838/g.118074 Transcript_50838/m.118074 type:complete len:331 (-) Transcript_50838:203-1195(-)
MARCIVITAVIASAWWAFIQTVKERDFWWLVLLGFSAGTIGPWFVSWLHSKWCSTFRQDCRQDGYKRRSRRRHRTWPLQPTTVEPLQVLPAGGQPRAIWIPLQKQESGSSASKDSDRSSRKLVPDPENKGKWKYVDTASESDEASTLVSDGSEGECTPRLGPPTPPVPNMPVPSQVISCSPASTPSTSISPPMATRVFPLPKWKALPPPVDLHVGDEELGTLKLLHRKSKSHDQALSDPLAGCDHYVELGSDRMQQPRKDLPQAQVLVDFEERASKDKLRAQASRVMKHVAAFEAKFAKDEAAGVPEALRRVEKTGWHMAANPLSKSAAR